MWINPKLDWSDNDKCKPVDFNRIENNTGYMADETETVIIIKMDWGRTDYPFADELNRIEQNIEEIRTNASLPVSLGYQSPKTWLACNPINFGDLNRIERNINALKIMNELIPQNFVYCGTFNCGGGAI